MYSATARMQKQGWKGAESGACPEACPERIGATPRSSLSVGSSEKSQNHTESQNSRGWKGPLWVI